ncbi:hypothetical protein WYO_0190 [Methylobacterium sp. GXF4]|uniref:hypothetical protein n=1 Tax=Methylobacterium sp. GXF4 TaxID=1096546 RepID=UPI0002698F56|nr:hypothetical protein [Methylobacterium sp. GXF4]EIZ87153.1 hypothetical protein WYO_0190 [Methylobacterium sp. GXF4]
MSAGVGYRQRAIESAAALIPGYLTEYSRLIDNGMVFKWDASGPLAGMDQFANALPEFTYLALDDQPVRSYIKRSRPGVRPVIWDKGPAMPDFTLQQFLDSEAAATQSAAASALSAVQSQTFATNSARSATSAAQSLAQAQQVVAAAEDRVIAAGRETLALTQQVLNQARQVVAQAENRVLAAARQTLDAAQQAAQFASYSENAARGSARQAAFYAAQAVALIGVQHPAPTQQALALLLQSVMALLPTEIPSGNGVPWLNNGVLSFTPMTDAQKAAAIAAANNVDQSQLNPVSVMTLLQGMAAVVPTDAPDNAGQPWYDNGTLAFTA